MIAITTRSSTRVNPFRKVLVFRRVRINPFPIEAFVCNVASNQRSNCTLRTSDFSLQVAYRAFLQTPGKDFGRGGSRDGETFAKLPHFPPVCEGEPICGRIGDSQSSAERFSVRFSVRAMWGALWGIRLCQQFGIEGLSAVYELVGGWQRVF